MRMMNKWDRLAAEADRTANAIARFEKATGECCHGWTERALTAIDPERRCKRCGCLFPDEHTAHQAWISQVARAKKGHAR